MRRGLTIIEVVVALVALAILVGVGLVALSVMAPRHRGAPIMKEAVNLRNIHLAMATYATSNKDYFPGLTSAGDYMGKPFQGEYYGAMPNAGSGAEETNGDGCTLETGSNLAEAILLEEGLTAPAQWISPGETDCTSSTAHRGIAEPVPDAVAGAKVVPTGGGAARPGEVRGNHSSFAMLAYGKPGLKPEWKANQNQQACVLATRLIFNGRPGDFNGVWTGAGSGQWKGSVVRGDNSTSCERFKSGSLAGAANPFGVLKYDATLVSNPATESSSVVGIFGRSADMRNFDATPATGMVGSVND